MVCNFNYACPPLFWDLGQVGLYQNSVNCMTVLPSISLRYVKKLLCNQIHFFLLARGSKTSSHSELERHSVLDEYTGLIPGHARYRRNWPAVKMILPTWCIQFNYLAESCFLWRSSVQTVLPGLWKPMALPLKMLTKTVIHSYKILSGCL